MIRTLRISGALVILFVTAFTVPRGARLAAEDGETVRRRVLVPDFVHVQPASFKARPGNDFALKLRARLEESDRFTIIDQKLLIKLRPALKTMPAGIDDWAKLAEELNCENVVIGSVAYGSRAPRVQVGVYESVTRAEVIALRADLPPGNQGAKVSDQLVTDVSQQMHEKLEQQRKQRLKEIEAEKKRVAEMRAKNPDYDSAAAPGGELTRVAIFDFSDQTGSRDYQYLGGSLADTEAETVAQQAGAEILISGVYSIVPGQNREIRRRK